MRFDAYRPLAAPEYVTEKILSPMLSSNALALGAITVLAMLYQTRWGTVADTSWLITVCEKMLSGSRLYIDMLETNPPFSVFLYLPAVALAKAIGIAPEVLVHLFTYLSVLVGLALAGYVAQRAAFEENPALFAMAPAFYALFVLFPGLAFSEREHIAMALFLPLMVLMAWRARPGVGPKPGLPLATLVGLSGCVLLLVKPYYALMVLLPALFVAWRQRSLRSIFAIEHWIIGLVCLAYLGAVLLFYPEFVSDIYPLLADAYAKVTSYPALALRFGPPWALLLFLVWRLWPVGGVSELASVATLTSVAAMAVVVYQAKGWAYHAYPATVCAMLALLCLLALPASERRGARSSDWLPLFMKPSWKILMLGLIAGYAPFFFSQKPHAATVEAIRAATVRPSVVMIGSDLSMGHPLTRMVDGAWSSIYHSDWVGTSALLLSMNADNPAEEARYDAMVSTYALEKRREIETVRPDLIVIEKDEPLWSAFLIQHFGFSVTLSSYHILTEDGEIAVYLRNDYPERPANGS